jgi:putative ABC transport system permease protein
VDSLLQDLRWAMRRLRRGPWFAATVVLTLAVGIGATAATFAVVDATVLQPLPYPDAGRLVRLREVTPEGEPFSISEPDYLDFAASFHTLDRVAALKPVQVTLTGAGDAMRVEGTATTSGLFSLLGVRPAVGRLFTPSDDAHGQGTPVVLLSHALWQERFGGNPDAVGRVVRLDGLPYTVAGVLPPSVAFPPGDVWIPLAPSPHADRTDKWLDAIGRLTPGRSLADARVEASVIASRLSSEHPELKGWSAQVTPLADWLIGPGLRRMVWVLLGAVGLLLVLACANIGSLLLTRAAERQGEMGVRTALGASRRRLVRQLMTESAVLAVVGGVLGVGLAFWMLDALSPFLSDLLPLGRTAAIDWAVLVFTATIVAVCTVGFGLMPALHGAGGDLRAAMRPASRGATAGGRRWTDVLVGVQMALAMLLLVGAFLLAGSFSRLASVDPGFEARDVLTVPVLLPDRSYGEQARLAFLRDAEAALTSLPGVESAAATATNPFREWGFANDVTPAERAADAPPSGFMQAGWRSVTPGFFTTLRVPVLRGRTFTAADRDGAVRVAVISRSLAERLWPGNDALGHRLYWGGLDGDPRTVIGVVGDVRDVRLDARPAPMLYLPYDQVPMNGMTLLVRVRPGVNGVAEAVRRQVHDLDPRVPVPEVRALERNRAATMAAPKFRMVLVSLIGGIALLLAVVGLYAVVAFTVSQRTREIAIRVAIGGAPAQVASVFFRRGLRLTFLGGIAGLMGALAVSGTLGSLLYDTDARDPGLFALAAALLTSVALVASYVPARRAATLDPLVALRRSDE